MEQRTFFLIKQHSNGTVEVSTLKDLISEITDDTTIYFAFSDTSTAENYPGWPLRNYIAMILHHW